MAYNIYLSFFIEYLSTVDREFLDSDHLLQMPEHLPSDDLSLSAPGNNIMSGSFVLVT